MQHFWWAYALGAAGLVIAGRRAWRYRWGRAAFDSLLHRVPVVRDLLVGLAVARFVRVLGLCISSGIGLLEALDMAGKSSGRHRMRTDAERIARDVRAGGRLSSAMRSATYLPGFARRMLAAGEEAGELPRMCAVVARHHERDNALRTRDMSTVIEPVLIVTIAGIVLVVALAVFVPMWDMMKLVG
jgi:type II secretory pathway component PulF